MVKKLLMAAVLMWVTPGAFQYRAVSAQCEVGRAFGGTTEELTAAQMQSDFDLMRHAVEEAHPGLYRYSTKAEMDREFDAQRAKLSGPMTKPQFEVVVAQTLASIRCGHTRMHWDPEMEAAMANGRTFPLRVVFEGTRLMVLLNQTSDDRIIRPGMELVSINGHSVADLVSQFWSVNYADGDIETAKRHDIAQDFAKDYWWLVEQPENFTVTAIDRASGQTVVAKLAGVTEAQRTANHNHVNDDMQAGLAKVRGESYEKLSLRFLKDPEIAEIRIPSFTGDDFPRWIEDTFRTLREKGTRTLIIDLRSNGGGEDSYGVMLVSYLTDKPFRYVDHVTVNTITWSFQDHWDAKRLDAEQLAHVRECLIPNPGGGFFVTEKLQDSLGEKQPGKFPFLGDVFILIDGATFSTAADVCAVTHHLERAIFIGEETAGAYYGNNSGTEPTVTLPNSKVRFGLPLCASWNAVSGYDGKRRGTTPDHVAVCRTADVLRGVDTQLELALKLARRPPER
jgi:C-terminal processing protease CtpA/Prc